MPQADDGRVNNAVIITTGWSAVAAGISALKRAIKKVIDATG